FFNGVADPRSAACFVFVAFEFARYRDGVKREPVRRGVDLGVNDVGAGERAGAGDDRQQPRMIRRDDRARGDAAPAVEAESSGEIVAGLLAGGNETGVRELVG